MQSALAWPALSSLVEQQGETGPAGHNVLACSAHLGALLLPQVQNPAGVAPAALPLVLRMLTHVPMVVSSRRSQTSGSPTHVVAKLFLE